MRCPEQPRPALNLSTVLAAAAAITLVLSLPGSAAANPKHGAWTKLLSRYVSNGLVDYEGLASQRARLDAYLGTLATTSANTLEKASRNEQMAFWINAYNAYTVALILDNYPLESIWKITPFWQRVGGGPFALEFIPLGHLLPGAAATGARPKIALQTIEHRVLRRAFNEPRIHFAIVCASLGCPVLRSEAYEADRLEGQLDQAAETFMRTRTKNHYDAGRHVLQISPIFKWFGDDFAPAGGPIAYFRRYADRQQTSAMAAYSGAPKLSYSDYDWSLNVQPN